MSAPPTTAAVPRRDPGEAPSRVRRFLRENGLALVIFGMFLLTWLVGQTLTGWHTYNSDQEQHGQATIGFARYLTTGHFGEATFENWESEFLQMGTYVLLLVWLRQKGSPESKSLESDDEVDERPEHHRLDPDAPWPVRRGGFVLAIYKNSLAIAFFALFLASFLLHGLTGHAEYNAELKEHGETAVSTLHFMRTSEFWFQSFQNWQSEFLAIGAIVVLGIYLRQQGSPESKPVHAPHKDTGSG